jgi:hypothetical protein
MEIKIDEKQIADVIINELKRHNFIGSMKVRRTALLEFLEKFEGKDLTDPSNIKPLEQLNEEK